MDDKEMARLTAEADARKEMDEHLRKEAMAGLTAATYASHARKEMEDRMMAKMNGFDSPTEEEGLSPKRR